MNESQMPREWWHDVDDDETWITKQELRSRQLEEEEIRSKDKQVWEQMPLDFGGAR